MEGHFLNSPFNPRNKLLQHQRKTPTPLCDGLRDGIPSGIFMTIRDFLEVEISPKFQLDRLGIGVL